MKFNLAYYSCMWWKQGKVLRPKYEFKGRKRFLIDSSFQLKYSFLILFAVMLPVLGVLGTAYYFIKQNYEIFIKYAYLHNPSLVSHLQMEQNWINVLLLSSVLGLGIYLFLFSVKMTAKIVGPVNAMETHIKKLIRGDWSQPDLKTRKLDDYKELVSTYNYFYKSLKRHTQWELKQLKSLKISPYATDSIENWESLVNCKAEQLKEHGLESEDYANQKFIS